jgi:general stress protein YciG
MPGSKLGGQKAAAKNLAKDPDFYKKIGKIGGQNGNTGGFAANPTLARIAGARGGRISRRSGPSKKTLEAREMAE